MSDFTQNYRHRYTQAGRPLLLETPSVGPDAFLLEKVSGTEALSELFSFRLELLVEARFASDLLLSGEPALFDQVLGQPATVTVALPNNSERTITGLISRLDQGSQ